MDEVKKRYLNLNEDDISLSNLYRKRFDREKTRLETYQQIYRKVMNKIMFVNNVYEGTEYLYSVPPFISGKPLFDARSCVAFVMVKLKKKGFIVKYVHPNLIYVNWQIDPKHFPENKKKQMFIDNEESDDFELEQLISSRKKK